MRISDWVTEFGVSVKPAESRPDSPAGDVVYRIRDVFTTRDGSWEPSNVYGSIPQWARDTYLRPWGADDYFDDAGGDHHLFARVLDLQGEPVKRAGLIRYWSDGFDKLGDPTYQRYVRMTPKQGSGWANMDIYNGYNPATGTGAWCWCPEGAADVAAGGGMPLGNHISTFVVWQAEPRTNGGGNGATADEDTIRRAAWGQTCIPLFADSAFAAYARRNDLGAPQTEERDVGGYRIQGYANGIVLAPIGEWQNIRHISW